MKERSSARDRKTFAIRGAHFETSEEGPLKIDFILVTNDIQRTFYQGCNKHRTHLDLLLTEKDKIVKKPNTLRKQINQLHSNIETLTVNLKNLKNKIKAKSQK